VTDLRLVGDADEQSIGGPVVLPDTSCDEVFADILEDGPTCVEYQNFELLLPRITSLTVAGRVLGPIGLTTIWNYIDDAVDGTGGFVNGGYLCPHMREWNRQTNKLDDKFLARTMLAPYDNFVAPIVNTPWNYINQNRSAIERKFADGFPAAMQELLEGFWLDADDAHSSIISVLDYAAQQARRFGTGWIFVDRPDVPIDNAAQDAQVPVYAYCVSTKDVLWWKFDDDFQLACIAVKEPLTEVALGISEPPYNLRIWTRTAWAVYGPPGVRDPEDQTATTPSESWYAFKGGANELGEIPAVQLFDRHPGPGKGLGITATPTIARLAMTVYNIDSEIREIQRNTGFPFLAVPMKDPSRVNELVIGTENILGFSDQGGRPEWVTQQLSEAKALADDREAKKNAAYAMEHMAAILGYVQTTSGFHAEVEFDKTNRRIGDFAASVEDADFKVARLVMRYRGWGNDAEAERYLRKSLTINYPRDFGIRDWDAQLKRLQARLDMVMGVDDAAEAIYDYYAIRYPMEDKAILEQKAEKAAKARYAATGGGPPGTRLAVAEVEGAPGAAEGIVAAGKQAAALETEAGKVATGTQSLTQEQPGKPGAGRNVSARLQAALASRRRP